MEEQIQQEKIALETMTEAFEEAMATINNINRAIQAFNAEMAK